MSAQDPAGLTVSTTLSVTVPNQAPVVVGSLAAQSLTVGGGAVTVDVASGFSDPEGDTLSYSVASSNAEVVTVSVSGSVVTLTPVGVGSASVTVSAQDPAGLTVSTTLSVSVSETVAISADLLVDTNRDGRVDSTDEAGEASWTSASGAVFWPNPDDDDEDGTRDWKDEVVNGDADLLDMAPVVVRRMPGLTEAHTVVIEMDFTTTTDVSPRLLPKLFLQRAEDSFELLLNEGFRNPLDWNPPVYGPRSTALSADDLKAGDVQLFIESALGRTHGFDGNLTLRLKVEEGGTVISQDEVALRGSPILLSHHLQPAERLFVSDVGKNAIDPNWEFIDAIEAGLPDFIDLYEIKISDLWTQDFMQAGYVQRPSVDGVTTHIAHLQVARLAPLMEFLHKKYLGPDVGYVYPAGNVNMPLNYTFELYVNDGSSLNAGGNIEILPPHAHNGSEYPFGRIVIGGPMSEGSGRKMMGKQFDFLNAQEVQAPVVVVPTDWLLVGHVDEIFLVVPNHNAGPDERPWAIVIASPALAVETLKKAKELGHGDAAVLEWCAIFGETQFGTTVNELLSDSDLLDYNDAAQGIIDTVRETLKAEIGLTDADFREVPALYEEYNGKAVALMPAMQNLIMADTVLFIPDPEGPRFDGTEIGRSPLAPLTNCLGHQEHNSSYVDLWQEETRDSLEGLGLEIRFVDTFYAYHVLLGEAHCGTNIEREGVTATPWWTEAD